jgi:hypothetical protein
MNDMAQVSSGLYGAIIVRSLEQKNDPVTDKVFMMSRKGMRTEREFPLNGSNQPEAQQSRAGSSIVFASSISTRTIR